MLDLANLGADWLYDEIDNITDEILHVGPKDFNEENRYLPDSVTKVPGYMSFDVNPYMKELVEAADPRSSVREVNLMKGVQVTYTTLLESVLLYYMAHIKTRPCMLISADKEQVTERISNCVIPMLNQSELADIITTSDEGNSRKTGKTAKHLQWRGGGFLVPAGANNANKMRMWSIMLMLKDEIDAWPDMVGKDGDPDGLTDDRCSAFWEIRKIYRGSTPLIKDTSKIHFQYLNGDQRKYHVLCKGCSFPQELRWNVVNKENGIEGGFKWDTEEGKLILESVRYVCPECGHEHYEYDKKAMFATENGALWVPTAKPKEPGIRSYHLPAFYSPVGFQPWYKCVSAYLNGYDDVAKKVKDIGKYQIFYNNILGMPFEVRGAKIEFESVSAHRRPSYRLGEIPNHYAEEFSGSKILFLTCQVDVHKRNLAVAVMGWTIDSKCYVIDYWRFERDGEEDSCEYISSPVWARLAELIEEKVYIADDGTEYGIMTTFVDAGFSNDTINQFCSRYESGVYPILGRERPAKNQKIVEFSEFTTKIGTVGYKILVDHYKDRLAPVLRREWHEDDGEQKPFHFNTPIDITDDQLKELTKEVKKKKKSASGTVSYVWDRVGNAENELWDLLVYGNCAVEVIAWSICIKHFELENLDWNEFWEFIALPSSDDFFCRVSK